MNNIDLSIIIPTFNVENYILETLESVYAQKTMFIFEVIIVDDGSSDLTRQIVEEYGMNKMNFSIIQNSNHGAGYSRNVGLKNALGKYVYFLDGDDLMSPGLIEKCLNDMNDNNLDVILFSGACFGLENKKFPSYLRSNIPGIISGKETIATQLKEQKFLAQPCLYITRKEHIINNNVAFPEGIIYEDSYFSFFVIYYAKRVMTLQSVLFKRRLRIGSVMNTSNEKKIFSFVSSFSVYKMIVEKMSLFRISDRKIYQKIKFLQFRGAVSEFFKMEIADQKLNSQELNEIVSVYTQKLGGQVFPRSWIFAVKIKHSLIKWRLSIK